MAEHTLRNSPMTSTTR